MAALFRMERGIPYVRMENAGRMAVESLLMVTVGVLVGRLAWVALAPADAGAPLQDSATLSSESLQASGSASTTLCRGAVTDTREDYSPAVTAPNFPAS